MKFHYDGDCEVYGVDTQETQSTQDTRLTVSVETERLWIRSIQSQDEKHCITLLNNPVVQQQFKLDKVPKPNIKNRFDAWLMDWNNQNPFSGYVIFSKALSDFIGLLVMDYDFSTGFFMAYALDPNYWGKGYGSEAMEIAFQTLIPQLISEGYWQRQHSYQAQNAAF